MKKSDIKYFQDLLNGQLQALLEKSGDTVTGLKHQDNYSADPSDQATIGENQFLLLRIRDRESNLIHKIKKALKRIEEGDFGVCEECGEDISIQRLKARPVTTQCINCKRKAEALEKIHGT